MKKAASIGADWIIVAIFNPSNNRFNWIITSWTLELDTPCISGISGSQRQQLKPRLLTLYFSFFSVCVCTRIIVSKHPEYNVPPTDPRSIRVHDRSAPACPLIIIGRIDLDTTWTVKPKRDEKKIRMMAARAGADGILITGFDIDISAFNLHVTTNGYANVSGSDRSSFAASIRPRAMYLEQTQIYGYLIKCSEDPPPT